MATVKDMMVDALSKASKAAEQITNSVERAHAFTELANACANALSTKGGDTAEVEASSVKKEEDKKEEKKVTPKKEPVKKTTKKKEPEPEPEVENSGELTEEWDSYAMETLADEMAEFNKYCDQFDGEDDILNGMISDATEGVAKNREDVTPLNIKLILSYIKQLEEQANAAAEEEEE